MSTILGIISLTAFVVSVYIAFVGKGTIGAQIGIVGVLSFIYAIVGLYLGIVSRFEKEKFYFFCYIGMVLNTLSLAASVVTIYLGVRG